MMIYIRRVGPLVLHKRQKQKKIFKFLFMVAALIISISLVFKLLRVSPDVTLAHLMERSVEGAVMVQFKPDDQKNDVLKGKCGLPKPCRGNDYAFSIHSGATNIIGPQICFDGKMLIEKGTRGNWQGISIAVVNEESGEHVRTGSFNMWNGNVEELIEFLESIKDGSLVLMTTFDDPATKLNDQARELIANLGSVYISQIKFRDNWAFVGGKKTIAEIYFEQHIKNDRETNKYDAWPEMIEMEGCIPKLD